jgi:type II secretory pathway pseudopilin PulG
MRIKFNRQSASTLVEVVMSVAVIGVMGSALLGSFAYGFALMGRVRENQRATQIIMEKVETIRLYRWEQVLTPGFIPSAFTEVFDPQCTSNSMAFNGTVLITNVPGSASYQTNMRQLVITLDWQSADNNARTRKFATIIAKDGLQNYVY